MELVSDAFKNNGEIPAKYTCQGDDISPPLRWSEIPTNTKSLALIVDDPDAPDPAAPRLTWVHWVVYNIPPNIDSLPENFRNSPQGAQEGMNDFKSVGYGGPCPPIGRHHYHHKLYALDIVLPQMVNVTKKDLEKAMEGHILAETDLVGTYLKH
ncbi:YbhB/YbcL family Raf kinase inhibitor-like protein [Bdellovibrio reynosensis]|uniref:YbhB/YbcL family Raf kinase inhibitor-like protein n=1 Tax=Bdellovibrio reynosensis TaxID=2835041 RepID=A0ABY4C6D5_9BACT|nr:YbhB/YbcL family Raf kinase inhibitor-like protein [Bdellovibrio reynosensis]UOF00485.1 YbhB/YbcL family Raf kinase inhibitor-like protein [Bdellovibrio reynosensis]